MHDCLVAFRQPQNCRVTTLWFANPHLGAWIYFITYTRNLSLPSTLLLLLLIISSGSFVPAASQCRPPQMLQSYSCHWSRLPRVQVRLMAPVPLWLLPSFRSSQQIQPRSHDVKPKRQQSHESNGRHNEQISIDSISLKTSPLGTS